MRAHTQYKYLSGLFVYTYVQYILESAPNRSIEQTAKTYQYAMWFWFWYFLETNCSAVKQVGKYQWHFDEMKIERAKFPNKQMHDNLK